MSTWYETENEDIEINHDQQEVGLYVCSDDFGSIYKTLTFDQVRKIADEIEDL